MNNEKVYLMIIDGFGEGKNYKGNAIKKAKMPNIKALQKKYPSTLLKASGHDVGIPKGAMGNSEVGHFTIGAGRIVFQLYEEINQSIKDKSFFKKKELLDAIKVVKKNNHSALHLIGMISDEGVHSHIKHLFALLELAKQQKVGPIYIHAITDGRDVAEKTATKYIKQLQKKIKSLGLENKATIASIIGRYYAMDRDNNWNRTKIAYDLYTQGKGIKETDPLKAIKNAYKRDIETDYYIDPIILDTNAKITNKDSVIFFNYRTDRPRQLTYCFTGETKIGFKPHKKIKPHFVCFGEYSDKASVVFPPPKVTNNLGTIIANNNKTQLRIAETEKYAHVTYFFNSQEDNPYKKETRIMVKSPKVPSYDKKPEMSAPEITKTVLKELKKKDYDLVVQNFANCDLVGHAGDFKAAVKACETVDKCLGKIYPVLQKRGYHLLITADHGNAERMIYEDTGQPCPSHTTNPVPAILVSEKYKSAKLRKNRGLKDIATTILDIMDIKKPKEMSGVSLIKKS